MAGIGYKEEVLCIGNTLRIESNYSGYIEETSEMSWAQVFYLKSSMLLCRVYGSALVLDQIFLSVPSDDFEVIESLEKNMSIKVNLKGRILKQIFLTLDNDFFSLFVATSEKNIYKLTFYQDIGFTEARYMKEFGAYLLETDQPCSFTLISISEEEYEVCLGLETGHLCFAILPQSLSNEFLFPSKTTLIEIGSNILKKVTAFFLRPPQEKLLSLANIKEYRIATFSNYGVVRIYNTYKRTLISELDLECGLVDYFKFNYFVLNEHVFLAIGLPEKPRWWVLVLSLYKNKLETIGKFCETGLLIDLAIDCSGIWTAWTDDCRGKIVLKPFKHENESEVFSYDDQIFIENLSDVCCPDRLMADRILVPGRFSEKIIKSSFCKTLGLEDLKKLEENDIKNLEEMNLKMILNYAKMSEWNSSQISALCCNEESGNFLPVVVRGDKIGLIRAVRIEIEKKSLFIQKKAVDWNPLNKVSFPESLVFFRMNSRLKSLDRSLMLVHIWRQSFYLKNNENLVNQLREISTQPISDSLNSLLKRSIPVRLGNEVLEVLSQFECYCTQYTNAEESIAEDYYPRFTQVLLGNSLRSSLKSLSEYFIDLSLLLMLCDSFLKNYIFEKVETRDMNFTIAVAEYLWVLSETLGSRFLNDCSLKKVFEKIVYPSEISSYYIQGRSEVLLHRSSQFAIENFGYWLENILTVALKDILVYSKQAVPKNYIFLEILVRLAQHEYIERWFSLLGKTDATAWYFLAKVLIVKNRNNEASNLLVRAATDLVSGSLEKNYDKLIEGPWKIREIQARLSYINIFNLFNSAISSDFGESQKEAIILSDFIVSSFYPDFSNCQIEKTIEKLVSISRLNEGFTIVNIHNNADTREKMIMSIIDVSLSKSWFSKVLDLPLISENKEIVKKYLIKKTRNEHFDLFSVINCADYKTETSNLFLNLDRSKEAVNVMSWTMALYVYGMRGQLYATAASASYKIMSEIENLLAVSQTFSEDEKRFLFRLIEENLLLTLLASRNVNKDKALCYFLYTEKRHQKKEKKNYSIRKVVTLSELEYKLSNLEHGLSN